MKFKPQKTHPKCWGIGFTEDEQKFLRMKHCTHIKDGLNATCKVYEQPSAKWRYGCPMATNYRPDLDVPKEKIRIGQQKSKRNR